MAMPLDECLTVLREREMYLQQRIRAKRSVGWDVQWDVRERDALGRAILELTSNPSLRTMP